MVEKLYYDVFILCLHIQIHFIEFGSSFKDLALREITRNLVIVNIDNGLSQF